MNQHSTETGRPAGPVRSKKISALLLAAGMMLQVSLPLHASEANGTATASIAELALHDRSGHTGSIRMKLHGIEDLRAERIDSPLGSNSMDELKKQAQTRYLAKKLKKDEAHVRPYVDLAWAEASRREFVDPELLIAIIQKESEFRPKAKSRYGAQGLMQVVRRWHHDKLHPSESLYDPAVNIRVGADVLEEYLAQAGGDMNRALRKYSGNARGYVNTVLKETRALARIAEQATSAQG
ncbi:MAG TPA: transglycosylase SLT domain-containing protein [Burkholderiaceae bacterium]|nr:transglycosylase SLT domain-containing protein [Burkholderiaceae bacterium]